VPVDIAQEEYSIPWQGVSYEANFYGHRYPCVVAIHHLKLKIGKEAVAEFRARLAEVERATEAMLILTEIAIARGQRKPNERVIVALEADQGR
jgi:hypothetical protein